MIAIADGAVLAVLAVAAAAVEEKIVAPFVQVSNRSTKVRHL